MALLGSVGAALAALDAMRQQGAFVRELRSSAQNPERHGASPGSN
jgi:hypothetical protein